MRRLYTFLLLLGLLNVTAYAQDTINGLVLDFDTKQPISCAHVYFYFFSSEHDDVELSVKTGMDGRFTVISEFESDYYIEVYHEEYRSFDNEHGDLVDDGNEIKILMYSYDSESFRITDIADQDKFDLGFSFSFFAPPPTNTEKIFGKNISFELYNLNMRFKLANNFQFGVVYNPIKLTWNNYEAEVAGFTKTRYFSASTGLFPYLRFIPTTLKKSGSRGLFVDIGAGYNLPYYFSYSYVFSGARCSYTKIHKFNDFQIFARLGFAWGAIKVNYGLTDFLKNDYVRPPKLFVGCELLIPGEF